MCSKSCLVPSNKQPLDVAKLVEARWPGLRTENCNKGFEGSLKKTTIFCVLKVMPVCVSMRVGARDPNFKFILSSLSAFLSFPC